MCRGGIGNNRALDLKIDNAETAGLEGVANSLAYRVHEIERHLHGWERWIAAAATPSGETHRADRVGVNNTPFQVDGGNDTWGAWVQVIGSDDTPVDAGRVKFDMHRMIVVTTERSGVAHIMQLACGDSPAAALASGDYSEYVFVSSSAHAGEAIPVIIQTRRKSAGSKVWSRIWVVGQNTGTADFYLGLHEYEG
jgi:hypothetical protein